MSASAFRLASAQAATYAPVPKGWRTCVLTTRVEPTAGATKAWEQVMAIDPNGPEGQAAKRALAITALGNNASETFSYVGVSTKPLGS
mgnify:CR=1 FL=1